MKSQERGSNVRAVRTPNQTPRFRRGTRPQCLAAPSWPVRMGLPSSPCVPSGSLRSGSSRPGKPDMVSSIDTSPLHEHRMSWPILRRLSDGERSRRIAWWWRERRLLRLWHRKFAAVSGVLDCTGSSATWRPPIYNLRVEHPRLRSNRPQVKAILLRPLILTVQVAEADERRERRRLQRQIYGRAFSPNPKPLPLNLLSRRLKIQSRQDP